MRALLLACAGAVTVSVLPAGCAAGAAGAVPARAGHACQPAAYVSISYGRVTPVNLVTRNAGKPIVLPQPGIGHRAAAIAVLPDGKTAYVFNTSNEGRWLTPINTATNKTGSPLPLLDFQYGNFAITANSKNVYMAGRQVTLISGHTSKIVEEITFPHTGHVNGLYLTAGGTTLYAASIGMLTPISTATNTPGTGIALPFLPSPAGFAVAVTPDGKTAYLSNWNKSTVVPVDLATGIAGTPIKRVGLQPDQIVITPNGSTAYVEAVDSNTVTPINTTTNIAGKPVKVGGTMALTPNGKTLFVVGQNTVTPINTTTNTPGKPIKVNSPGAIAITPDSKTAWVVADNSVVSINVATGKVSKPTPVAGGPGTIALKSCLPRTQAG